MADDSLRAITDPVPFDDAISNRLVQFCAFTALSVTNASRTHSHAAKKAQTDFKGHFADLFARNAQTAAADAAELTGRLTEVADLACQLAAEAQAERERRAQAAAWQHRHDERNVLERAHDAIFGEDTPPPAGSPPAPKAAQAPKTTPRAAPAPGGGGTGAGTSSARPDLLRAFATTAGYQADALADAPQKLNALLQEFAVKCRWGSLDGQPVVAGFRAWNAANAQDVAWARTVADAFAKAGAEGEVVTLPNSALTAALAAGGVRATRDDLAIDPAGYRGAPPTSGYANDPVNTATGNFVEVENDLTFEAATVDLAWRRTYNSFDEQVGAFGPGWSSRVEAGLTFEGDAARMRLDDGRVVTFPRLGEGWDRATGDNLWLTRHGDGFRVVDNAGGAWEYDAAGTLLTTSRGPGTTVTCRRESGRLVGLDHARGRSLTLTWENDRVVAVTADDGRTATYTYDERGRLTAVDGEDGSRTYGWCAAGIVDRVTDADGVIELVNTYDARRRVVTQLTPHGRTVRFAYLDPRVTVVADEAGTRANTWMHDRRGRLIGVVDADERRQSMSYDAHGNLVSTTARSGEVTVHEYDARGRRVRTVTPTGAELTFGYDEQDRVTTVVTEQGAVSEFVYVGDERNPVTWIDPEGGRTEFVWEAGLLRRVVDPTGVVVEFGHDSRGDVVSSTDALGRVAHLERDRAGRITAAVTPSGLRTEFRYDERGRLASRRDPDGAQWRFAHSAAGRPLAVTDPLGARSEMEYGDHGDVVRAVDPLGHAITTTLDDMGNLATTRLPDGSTWRFDHDALSRLVSAVDPSGGVWSETYDVDGTVVSATDPTGARESITIDLADRTVRAGDGPGAVTTTFDALGRPVSQTEPDGSVAMTVYDRCGRPIELLDGDGGLTRLTRDAAGRVVSSTDPTGRTTSFEYDTCGRHVATIDPAGGRTTFEYDVDGRAVRSVDPAGEVSTVAYDECGRVVATDRPGHGRTVISYDATGRVARIADPWNGRRSFRYDAAGRLVAAVDGNGAVTRFEHDANGNVTAVVDPLGGTTTREYDAAGRLVTETDPLGRVWRAGYDAAGRQTKVEDPDGGVTEWGYDAAGRLDSITVDGRNIGTARYDPRRRVLTATDRSLPGRTVVHELEWNRRGGLVRRSRDGRGVTWSYDGAGRRTAMTTPDGRTTTYHYDAGGLVDRIEHPVLGCVTFVRDGAGRVVESTSGDVVQSWERRDGAVVAHALVGVDGASRTRLERDAQGRIVAIDRDGATTRYTYDGAGQLVAATGPDGDETWTYDACGRQIRQAVGGATTTRRYDAAGQLLEDTLPDGTSTTYLNDGRGRRIRTDHADGVTREIVWGATGLPASIRDRDADGRTDECHTHVDVLGELNSVDDTEIWWDTAAFAGTPVLAGATPVLALGPATGIGERWTTPGWREARSGADPWNVDVAARLSGGLALGAAGEVTVGGLRPLEWLGARVYDAGSHGFLSTDPLEPTLGTGWAGNAYSYAGNDPLHALDPLGLKPLTDGDLAAYRSPNLLERTGNWVKKNKDYLIGGAAILGGVVLLATPFGWTPMGGAIAGGLLGGGLDIVSQKMATGEVDYKHAAGAVATGMASGAIGGSVGMMARGFGLVGKTVISATMNGAGNTGAYIMQNTGNVTPRGLIAAFVGGAVSGAAGGVTGKLAGRIAGRAGMSETGFASRRVADVLNFGSGYGGNATTSVVNGEPVDPVKASVAGVTNVGSGHFSDAFTPRAMLKKPWISPKEGAPVNPLYAETPAGSRWAPSEKDLRFAERLEDTGNAGVANVTGNFSEWAIDKGVDKVRDGNS